MSNLTKSDLYRLKEGLESVGSLTGFKFAYACAKNRRLVAAEVSILDELRAPSEEFLKYEEARIALAKKHSVKDENGNPRILNTSDGKFTFDIIDHAAFEAELKLIRAEHEEVIEANDEQLRRHEEFLKEESDLVLHLVNRSDVPEAISGDQMTAILEIVRDEE